MLADEQAIGITKHNLKRRVAEPEAKYGKTLDVAPLPKHAHQRIDPLSELLAMTKKRKQ
jgi:hypothetical protein